MFVTRLCNTLLAEFPQSGYSNRPDGRQGRMDEGKEGFGEEWMKRGREEWMKGRRDSGKNG